MMTKARAVALLGSIAMLPASTSGTPAKQVKSKPIGMPVPSPQDRVTASRAELWFGWDVARHQQAGNLVMSPSSLNTVLAMVFPGARGQTATEMTTMLHT